MTNILPDVENMGTNREKYQKIAKHVIDTFTELRVAGNIIHNRDLRKFAIVKERELGIKDFSASDGWLINFKRKFKIVSGKIVRFVSYKIKFDEEEIQDSAAFALEVNELVLKI